MDQYQFAFQEGLILFKQNQEMVLELELGQPPEDIVGKKEYQYYFDHLNQLYPSDTYKEYVVSANRSKNTIHLETEISKILFGRWSSSTRTIYELAIDDSCNACSLVAYSAVTNKVGFSPNIQTSGESGCAVE